MIDITKVIEIKDGKNGCHVCGGSGYYSTHTDRAREDGGSYNNTYPCHCNKFNVKKTAN